MTDPSNALQSFQQIFLAGGMALQPGVLDSDLYLHVDDADGVTRFTYVKLEGKTVTAFVIFAPCAPIEGKPCFAIGYAVPEAYQNQGRAKKAVRAALAEMQRGLGRVWPVFYVEAIVGAENKPSQRVAELAISDLERDKGE
jgi:RimJ/RimL family protein N-acetyltransferase